MKINKLKVITFSLIFSSIGASGVGCYSNFKYSNIQPPPPPKLTEEQSKSQNIILEENSNIHDTINTKTDDNKAETTITNKPNTDSASSINNINKKTVKVSIPTKKKTSNDVPKSSNSSKNTTSNTNKVKGQNILLSAEQYATPANEVAKMIKNPSLSTKKTVFLTFDDGPDINKTPQILKILKENNVHATFFILGSNLKYNANKNLVIQAYKNGNAIANHSFSHDLKLIYPKNVVSINTFMNEVNHTNSILKEILGPDFNCAVVRMPGGYSSRVYYKDPNLKNLNETITNNGFTLIDWNALSGDATPKNKTSYELLSNVKKQSKDKNNVILLMHDIHNVTVEALPSIIKYYKDNGYEFRVICN